MHHKRTVPIVNEVYTLTIQHLFHKIQDISVSCQLLTGTYCRLEQYHLLTVNAKTYAI